MNLRRQCLTRDDQRRVERDRSVEEYIETCDEAIHIRNRWHVDPHESRLISLQCRAEFIDMQRVTQRIGAPATLSERPFRHSSGKWNTLRQQSVAVHRMITGRSATANIASGWQTEDVQSPLVQVRSQKAAAPHERAGALALLQGENTLLHAVFFFTTMVRRC